MITTVQKWGNSMALRLSKDIIKKAQLKEGDNVEIDSLDGKIIITPKNFVSLDDLCGTITPENRHTLIDLGSAVGKEVW
jgi:antitoxin MazE